MRLTYRISLDGKAITCLVCLRTSHNPNDVLYRYCGYCHWFHETENEQSAGAGGR